MLRPPSPVAGPTVVKVGGHELEDDGWLTALAAALAVRVSGPAVSGGSPGSPASAASPVVLVHGGGRSVSALQERLGLVPEWRDGLRVTDAATLDVVGMVLSGRVNKRLVASLVGAGVRAAGVSGEDDGLLEAELLEGGALGRTGRVTAVRPGLLLLLLGAGITPVVSPLSRGPDGGALNVNADDAAVALASSLGADRLLLISNVPGVVVGAEPGAAPAVAPALPAPAIEALVAAGTVTGGMAPKLRAAARAVAAGVPDVRIGGLEMLTADVGTRVLMAAECAA